MAKTKFKELLKEIKEIGPTSEWFKVFINFIYCVR